MKWPKWLKRKQTVEPRSAPRVVRRPLEPLATGPDSWTLRNLMTDEQVTLPAHLGPALAACQQFKTVEEHAEKNPDHFAPLNALLRQGWLLTEAEVLETLRQNRGTSEAAPSLDSVAVVTRDRPKTVARCVDSILANRAEHGRTFDVIVVDDSADPQAVRQTLAEFDAGDSLRLVDAASRRDFADRLVAASNGDLDPTLAHFALVADGSRFAVGVNRNAAMLDAAGVASGSLDDDTFAEFLRSRTAASDRVSVAADVDPTAMSLYGSLTEVRALGFEAVDLSRVLGERLGADGASCLGRASTPGLAHLNDGTLASLLTGRAYVAVTATGISGDSGMPTAGYYLGLRGASLNRLAEDEPTYEVLKLTRFVARAAPELTLSTTDYFMSTAFGLDGRRLLPPFSPAYRNTDGVFGRTLRMVAPHSMFAHVPWAVRHEPDVVRRNPADSLRTWGTTLRATDLILAALSQCAMSAAADDVSERMRQLGRGLADLAARPDFRDAAREGARAQAEKRIGFLQRGLELTDLQAPWWRADVEACCEAIEAAVASDTFLDPTDATLEEVREHLTTFGRLLEVWPDVFALAQQLRAQGHRMSAPLRQPD